MSTLLSDIEYFRAYIDDLLILTKGSFEEFTNFSKGLNQLKQAGLKVNVNEILH
jgi:hypothetical protein